MCLQHCVRNIGNAIFAFHDDIGLLHCRGKIAMGNLFVSGKIMPGIVDITKFFA